MFLSIHFRDIAFFAFGAIACAIAMVLSAMYFFYSVDRPVDRHYADSKEDIANGKHVGSN